MSMIDVISGGGAAGIDSLVRQAEQEKMRSFEAQQMADRSAFAAEQAERAEEAATRRQEREIAASEQQVKLQQEGFDKQRAMQERQAQLDREFTTERDRMDQQFRAEQAEKLQQFQTETLKKEQSFQLRREQISLKLANAYRGVPDGMSTGGTTATGSTPIDTITSTRQELFELKKERAKKQADFAKVSTAMQFITGDLTEATLADMYEQLNGIAAAHQSDLNTMGSLAASEMNLAISDALTTARQSFSPSKEAGLLGRAAGAVARGANALVGREGASSPSTVVKTPALVAFEAVESVADQIASKAFSENPQHKAAFAQLVKQMISLTIMEDTGTRADPAAVKQLEARISKTIAQLEGAEVAVGALLQGMANEAEAQRTKITPAAKEGKAPGEKAIAVADDQKEALRLVGLLAAKAEGFGIDTDGVLDMVEIRNGIEEVFLGANSMMDESQALKMIDELAQRGLLEDERVRKLVNDGIGRMARGASLVRERAGVEGAQSIEDVVELTEQELIDLEQRQIDLEDKALRSTLENRRVAEESAISDLEALIGEVEGS